MPLHIHAFMQDADDIDAAASQSEENDVGTGAVFIVGGANI
jgi:hypothetical protein